MDLLCSFGISFDPLSVLLIYCDDVDLVRFMCSCSTLYKKHYPQSTLRNKFYSASRLKKTEKIIPRIEKLIWDLKEIHFESRDYAFTKHLWVSCESKILMSRLFSNSSIRCIEILGQPFGFQRASELAEILWINSTLTSLNLSHNNIGDEVVTSIAQSLKFNSNLRSLGMRANQIEKIESPFVEMLKTNTTLTSLNLSCNLFGFVGTKKIAEAVRLRSTPICISLWGMLNQNEKGFIRDYVHLNPFVSVEF